jgi:hypothetical protein
MRVVELQKAIEVFVVFWSSFYGKKIDDLNKEQRLAVTGMFNDID